MQNTMIEEFKDGKIWEHDVEYANAMVASYVKFLGGDDAMVEDILRLIHEDINPLTMWDGEKIMGLVNDYIDR